MPLPHISRVAAIVLRQFFLIRGSIARFMPLVVWVVVDMMLWGFLSRYLNTVASPGFNFVPALLGAVSLLEELLRIGRLPKNRTRRRQRCQDCKSHKQKSQQSRG